MADILVNNRIRTKGNLVVFAIDPSDDAKIEGQLITHGNYEIITSLESARYLVSGIEIKRIKFDSDDFNIIYEFKADEIDVKGGISNLDSDTINKIEEEMYKSDYDVQVEKYKSGGEE